METSASTKEKAAERMAKLKTLHQARNEARTHNHVEVLREDERFKLPANFEARQRQVDWMVNDKKNRDQAEERGLDYDRLKMLGVSALESERMEKLKKRKKNPDIGFSDYEAQTARQYNRLVKTIPVSMAKYEQNKERLGDAFYGGTNVILQGTHTDTKKAIDNMVTDVESQIERRKKFSRRRTHNDESDIDYINEKNARFNKKLERFYGEHTQEIKQNLERGTAI